MLKVQWEHNFMLRTQKGTCSDLYKSQRIQLCKTFYYEQIELQTPNHDALKFIAMQENNHGPRTKHWEWQRHEIGKTHP